MGFFSKLMKNPIVQMALPMMLTGGASSLFSGTGLLGGSKLGLGLGSMFSGMNPMMANALKQSMLGYGTAALTGAEKPGVAGAVAGISSIPFSYMSAANAANQFNKNYSGLQGQALKSGTGVYDYQKVPGTSRPLYKAYTGTGFDPATTTMQGYPAKPTIFKMPKKSAATGNKLFTAKKEYMSPGVIDADAIGQRIGGTLTEGKGGGGNYGVQSDIVKKYIKPEYIDVGSPVAKVTPWDIMSGQATDVKIPSIARDGKLLPAHTESLSGDIFTKFDPETGQSKMDMLGTLGPVGLGLLGEYVETEDERNKKEWEKNKERRRKELAWMYGVDPSMIEGEMDNPWNTGAFMNSGGIASLDMDLGGDVSGPGTGVSDSIDAKLSDGEFVMTAKAVENLGGGDRYEGARKMYDMMNMLDPESETMKEVV